MKDVGAKIIELAKETVDSFLASDGYKLDHRSISLYGADEHTLTQVEARMRDYLTELKRKNITIAIFPNDSCYAVDVGDCLKRAST